MKMTKLELRKLIVEESGKVIKVMGDEYGFPYYDGYIFCYLVKCIENEEHDLVCNIREYIEVNDFMIDRSINPT